MADNIFHVHSDLYNYSTAESHTRKAESSGVHDDDNSIKRYATTSPSCNILRAYQCFNCSKKNEKETQGLNGHNNNFFIASNPNKRGSLKR